MRAQWFVAAFGAVTVACGSQSSPPPSAESAKPAEPVPAAVPAPTAGRLYVTNETGGDISVVDVALQKVVATIPVGKGPWGIAVGR